jgi:hypothetical protein
MPQALQPGASVRAARASSSEASRSPRRLAGHHRQPHGRVSARCRAWRRPGSRASCARLSEAAPDSKPHGLAGPLDEALRSRPRPAAASVRPSRYSSRCIWRTQRRCDPALEAAPAQALGVRRQRTASGWPETVM